MTVCGPLGYQPCIERAAELDDEADRRERARHTWDLVPGLLLPLHPEDLVGTWAERQALTVRRGPRRSEG